MKPVWIAFTLAPLLGVALALPSSGAVAAKSPARGVASSDPRPIAVNDIAASGPDDAWAVGYLGGDSSSAYTQHWDGTAWTAVATPQRGSESSLSAVAEISATDVWAVGYSYRNLNWRTLTMHWDGSAWTIVPSPSPYQEYCQFGSVTAVPGSVWAAGRCGGSETPLIERWDGSAWHIVYHESPEWEIFSLSGSSDTDMWAVGDRYRHGAANLALTLHWNGTSWHRFNTARPARYGTVGVGAVASDDVWAVGSTWHRAAVAQHWDGTQWAPTELPGHPGTGVSNSLVDTSFNAANDGWAVGFWDSAQGNGPLLEHWDGTAWSSVIGPKHDAHGLPISWASVVSLSPTDAWVSGSTYAGGSHGVIAHWDGSAWTLSWSDPTQ